LNLWAVVEYVTKYATKAPKGSRRLGELLRDAVNEVCKYTEEGEGVDMLRKSLQRVYSRALGERDYWLYEAVQLGMNLPLVFPLMDVVSLNTSCVRVLKSGKQMKENPDGPIAWDSRVDLFDDRRAHLVAMHKKGHARDIEEAELKDLSLYEFYWKFRMHGLRILHAGKTVCLMPTPGISADCANVAHARHEAYARTCVVAYWRLMPTARRHAMLAAAITAGELQASTDKRRWGATVFLDPSLARRAVEGQVQMARRFLGVQDLYQEFDTDMKGRDGRACSWALALMEMLVDPMLVSWVPG